MLIHRSSETGQILCRNAIDCAHFVCNVSFLHLHGYLFDIDGGEVESG